MTMSDGGESMTTQQKIGFAMLLAPAVAVWAVGLVVVPVQMMAMTVLLVWMGVAVHVIVRD